jgi:hypothetical protein
MKDAINPSHYKSGKVEAIDAIEAATVHKFGIEAVCVANVIKYLWRYESKNGLEDVKKAKWYFNRLMKTNAKQIPTHDQIIESAIVNKSSREAVIVSFIIKAMLLPGNPKEFESIIEAGMKELETILIEQNNNENIRKNHISNDGPIEIPGPSKQDQEGREEPSLQEQLREPEQDLRRDEPSLDGVWVSSYTTL